MDLSRCITMDEYDRKNVEDGIRAIKLASEESGRDMWAVMKQDPDDPAITGATRDKYYQLFHDNESQFRVRYPTFERWAETQRTGFMFSNDANFELIGSKMTAGHSGSSYAMTMRVLQFIATNGFDAYVEKMNSFPPRRPVHPAPIAEVMPVADVPPVVNRANTGGAIPRHVCMCRNQQGLSEGWCGVASGGIPACEY
jgi:hypothetical protein